MKSRMHSLSAPGRCFGMTGRIYDNSGPGFYKKLALPSDLEARTALWINCMYS